MALPERVWFLRHAETSLSHVFNGAESDIGLSDHGRRQAEAAGEWFRQHGITAVISSGMIRAIDTAAPIARATQVPHSIEPELHERRVGALCGMSFSLTEGPWVETLQQWTRGNVDYTTEGAESFAELARRTVAAWNRVVRQHPGGRIAIVAHGVVVKAVLLSILEGWDVTHWDKLGRVHNLAVSEVVPTASGLWKEVTLLEVPEPVKLLENAAIRGPGNPGKKSEA